MQKEFILCEKRNQTMRERLGSACDLIENEQWLGMFRNRQIHFGREFEQSVKMVKSMRKSGKIRNAKHYFAKIWGKKNIERTLKIVREFLNRQISKLAEKREQKRRNEVSSSVAKLKNAEGLAKFAEMKAKFNLS